MKNDKEIVGTLLGFDDFVSKYIKEFGFFLIINFFKYFFDLHFNHL